MRFGSAVLIAVIASGIAAGAVFSCGEESSDTAEAPKKEAGSPDDASKAFTLDIAGASVEVPAGAFDAGAKVTLNAGTAPAAFESASSTATSASLTADLGGSSAAGKPLEKANVPMTIALDINEEAALALEGVEKTNAALCVYGLGKDNVFRVWRGASLSVDEATKRVKVPSIWLSMFRLYYCGSAAIAGAADVNATGTDVIGSGKAYFTCDLSQVANVGMCWSFVGKDYAAATQSDAARSGCESATGVFSTSECPNGDTQGTCAYNHGTTREFAYSYFAANAAAQQTVDTLKSACEATAGSKFFAAGVYVPTPEASQTTYVPVSNPTPGPTPGPTVAPGLAGCDGPRACRITGAGMCNVFVGSSYDGTEADLEDDCQGSGVWIPTGGCPTASMLGCCANYATSGATQLNVAFYDEAGMTAMTAQLGCTAAQGTWSPN